MTEHTLELHRARRTPWTNEQSVGIAAAVLLVLLFAYLGTLWYLSSLDRHHATRDEWQACMQHNSPKDCGKALPYP